MAASGVLLLQKHAVSPWSERRRCPSTVKLLQNCSNRILWATRRNFVYDGIRLRNASPAAIGTVVPVECSHSESSFQPSQSQSQTVKLEDILAERGACGVGFIANLRNSPSHSIIQDALTALGCMEHRGGCSADNDSGDGAGLMTRIPWYLLNDWLNKQGLPSLDEANTGVGMVFLPREEQDNQAAKAIMNNIFEKEGLKVLGWRSVPVNALVVGYYAKETLPSIEQVFVKVAKENTTEDIERELYISRKLIERVAEVEVWGNQLYFCSFSNQTIVYKGMLRSEVLGQFYLDLQNELYISSFAIYHRRYSTNTSPRWPLAQPMRFLGHNGEINTIQGNLNWMRSREASIKAPVWRGRESEICPYGNAKASDSANLDSVAELLIRSGRSPEEALMILVPEAYKKHPTLAIKYPEVVDFYEYYKGQMEAWDGPALLLFSDGKTVGACLDRNGLRPARYWRTKDDIVYVASEVGVLPMDESKVTMKGRLGPGMMIAVDLEKGEVYENTGVKRRVAMGNPYRQWLDENSRSVKNSKFLASTLMDGETVLRNQQAYGYSSEDVQMVIENMASQGKEPTFCMGDDIPLAVLSRKSHMLYDYFKQRFAQVTNPAIDPLREGLVMSLEVNLGKRENILEVGPQNAAQVTLSSPVLNEGELDSLKKDLYLKPCALPIFFDISKGLDGSLQKAINRLCEAADEAVRDGSQILILSDRADRLEPTRPAIPLLLAVGAVHQHLIQNGLRMQTSIVADSAQCFSTHHFACLIGYGASAVCPYLALETSRQWRLSTKTVNMMRNGKMPTVTIEQAQKNFCKAVESGLLKILSKMGISLLSSYCGAQIFEIYGLGKEVVDLSFCGSVSQIGGLNLDELARESLSFWVKAFSEDTAKRLENFGFIQFRPGGEYHGNNPEMSKLLHKAVRQKNENAFAVYQQHLANRPVNVLRDLLEFKSDRPPIPVGRVEDALTIIKRFCTGGMSLGAISRETHEAIAIAMNRVGGKSNSGEGGEDPVRWKPLSDVVDGYSPTLPHLKGLQNGDTATSAIKQVASGRFGVTPTFLVNAEQLEIKIAQGAKPGEGGQLPGKKVSAYIARLRNSKPGVPLISPPPHHDIYSIEDLAQLIFDLHQVNPKAKVSVKLVAEAGIGTVASGVAKGNADVIQISGHDGGTGASPISSIKHAGGPWELGLTETHQTLIENGLRERVVLRVDGGFKSGVDVMLAAAMGADEYGFGSVAMIATGCVMARICHTNNCPVGVASQREELRARFPGVPGDLVNLFLYVAEEVRGILAELGYEKLDDIIGRTDLLRPRHISLMKTQQLDLSYILSNVGLPKWSSTKIREQEVHTNGPVLDDILLVDPEISVAIEKESLVRKTVNIYNVDRAVCGRIAGVIAKKYGDTGFAGQLDITFVGSAGQSFGCFLTPGMNIRLVGEANDYVGKGMAGGEIVIVPCENTGFIPEDSTIVGNTCLYGATGGQLFVRGKAGERFSVRNSLAEAVVEGTGDHCCEYMTGGCVVVLGKVGRNVAAGMTGGLAYLLDEDDTLIPKESHPLVIEWAMVVQTETSPRVTTVAQTELASSSPPTVSDANLMALPPWLSSFTPKRKKQEISPDIFDFQQLKQSKPKAAKRATTVSRVTVDNNRMKVAEIVEPIVDKLHEEMQASDHKITRVELGKQTHAVVMHDAQHSVTSLVQWYDELPTKKDKLEEENLHLISVIQSITKSSEEGTNPSTSFNARESVREIERNAQKVQALDSWVDQISDLCVQVLKKVFRVMVKLEMIKEKLNQTFEAFKQNLEKVESNLRVWHRMPQEKLNVLQESGINPTRTMYLEFGELLENKSLVLKALIEEIDDALRLRMEVLQDIVSRCEKVSCKIVNQNGELFLTDVLSDLRRKIQREWKDEQFLVTSIQALVKYQIFLQKIQATLKKHNPMILSCSYTIVKTVIVAKNTHEPNPDELKGIIQKFEGYMTKHATV